MSDAGPANASNPPNPHARSKAFNAEHASRFLSTIMDGSPGCFELRIWGAGYQKNFIVADDRYSKILSGYFKNWRRLVEELKSIRGISVYMTYNPANLDLLSRSDHKIKTLRKDMGTKDTDILFHAWAYTDADPERPDGISSTDAEFALSLEVIDRILADHPEIRASSMWGGSGNGGWLATYLGSLPNTKETYDLKHRMLVILAEKYGKKGRDPVFIDPKTKNASRVGQIPGTLKCKGSNTPSRPWRLASLLCPEGHESNLVPFDLARWVAANEVEVKDEAKATGSVAEKATQAGVSNGQANLTAHEDRQVHDAEWIENRARKCIFGMKASIAGSSGHNQLYGVAVTLVDGFGLSRERALSLLTEWNAAKADPPESEYQVSHKIDSAIDNHPVPSLKELNAEPPEKTNGQANGHAGNGHGFLNGYIPPVPKYEDIPAANDRRQDDQQGIGPSQFIDNPDHLACQMIQRNFTHPDGLKIRFWRDEFHRWDGSFYWPLPKKEVAALVARSVKEQFFSDYVARLNEWKARQRTQAADAKKAPQPKLLPVTTRTAGDVTLALSELTLLSVCDCPAQPAWLESEGRWPASEIMPTKTALVHLPSLVDDLECTMKPTPRFFGRYAVSYGFDPDAPDPGKWLGFLAQLWPDDPQSISALQEWMGYLLTPDTSQQKIAMLIGPKRSGKGTISRVITAMLGADNVVNPTLSYLATNFGMSSLIGKPAAIITDARIGGRTDSAVVIERLLAISGEDAQTIDRKNKSDITMKLPTRFMIVSNELPRIHDASGALAGRLILFELTNSFYGQEDPKLFDSIIPELPGILKWAIEGWARLRKRGCFTQPEAGRELLTTMEDISSPTLAFLRERCVIGPEYWVPTDDLKLAWKFWCMSKGRDNPGTEDTFGRDLHAALPGLKKVVHRIKGDRVKGYQGVRCATEEELKAMATVDDKASDKSSDGDTPGDHTLDPSVDPVTPVTPGTPS